MEDKKMTEAGRSQEALRWQWLSGNIVHRDQWVDLRENTYLLPNGKEITPYYTTRNRNFSVIVARDPEGSYICVRQFRPGTETVTTEFPAGGMEEGEDPLGAAKRELLEETGYEAEQWTALGRIAPNATIANNYAYIFLAEGCRKASGCDRVHGDCGPFRGNNGRDDRGMPGDPGSPRCSLLHGAGETPGDLIPAGRNNLRLMPAGENNLRLMPAGERRLSEMPEEGNVDRREDADGKHNTGGTEAHLLRRESE